MKLNMRILTFGLFALIGANSSMAEDDFNPSSPPDPTPTYKVQVTATPADKANASGTGIYVTSTQVYINASSRDTDYEFKYWEKNGVRIEQSSGFYYTVETESVTFNAVFGLKDFNPSNPADPNWDYKYPLTLNANPEEACSFNITSGTRYLPNTYVAVSAYASQGFEFVGWYEDGQCLAVSTSFNYEMPNGPAQLTAIFRYNPVSPSDPQGTGQENVAQTDRADVNGDNVIDVSDATMVINSFLEGEEYKLKFDMNIDGAIDVSDSTYIINTYLNN